MSRNYFTSIDTSNTRIEATNVTDIYNSRTTINEVEHVYREQPVAVTSVSTTVFARAEPPAAPLPFFASQAALAADPDDGKGKN